MTRIGLRTLARRFVGGMSLHIDPQCCIDEPLVLCALIPEPTKKQRIDMERHLSEGQTRHPRGCWNEERVVEDWALGSVDLGIRERCDLRQSVLEVGVKARFTLASSHLRDTI